MAHTGTRTTWTRPASSFTSDRIQPSRLQRSTTPNVSKGKGKNKGPSGSLPKSEDVKRLEALHEAFQHSPKGANASTACFCQARQHQLSAYTPICRTCGLILCNLNLPQYSCPHCSSALLTNAAREFLVKQLLSQIDETLAREAEERDRAAENARQAAGAFPPLAGKTSSARPSPPPSMHSAQPNRPHKVMSLVSKTDKVVISSYYTVSSRPVTPHSETLDTPEQPCRVPPPPSQVSYAKKDVDPKRPWVDLKRGAVKYVPQSRADD